MELADYSRFFFALAVVMGLIWALAYGAKRTGLDKRLRGVSGARGRMQIVDVLYLDPKRKLTLVKVDTREYVILTAGDTATVIDTKDGVV